MIKIDSQIAALIVSQFLDDKSGVINQVREIIQRDTLDFSEEESQFLMQSDLIQQIALNFKKTGNIEKLHLMIDRMQDGDSYSFIDDGVKLNIKEEYFNKYLNFLRSKI